MYSKEEIENVFSQVYIILASVKEKELQEKFDKIWHQLLKNYKDYK